MTNGILRLMLGATVLAGLSACVPATTTATATEPATMKAEVPADGVYLATSDNGFTVPTVPVEKVPDEFERQVVDYETTEVPGTIVINPAQKHLYFVTGKGKAIRYGIAVGKAGFEWSGVANVTNRKPWPTWTPPPEMIERKPELKEWEKGQPGGPTNPLGARALYLTTDGRDYGYRIHGTPDWWSIGKNASSGCIRMINQDVMDLYTRVPDGAKVIVLTRDGQMPKGLKLPPPAPKKKAPAPKAAPAVATAVDAATTPAPAAVTGPMSTPVKPVPGVGVQSATPTAAVAPQVTPPPLPSATPAPAAAATTPLSAPTTATAPVPSALAAPTPAVTPTAPATACKVPLVNGVCPQN